MKNITVINFMGQRRYATIASLVILVISLTSLFYKGLNLGLDFTGGTQIELHYEHQVDIPSVREFIQNNGYEDAIVVAFGSDRDISIRTSVNINEDNSKLLVQQLSSESQSGAIEVRRIEYVGPQIGDELREDGGLGMLAALLMVMLYVSLRFQYKFSIGAVAALFHDVIITLGIFSLFDWDFDLTVLAAILAVVGYSLNDTIVIFDRIRENFREMRKAETFDVVNLSLTQTFNRTLITSLTTLLVLFVLFFVGGETIHNFALGLIVGVFVGTYSSIYVASNILLSMHVEKEDLMQKVVNPDEPYQKMP